MIGDLISAGASIANGIFNRNATAANNAAQIRQADLNRQTQVDFAQHGIKWKVEDARAAGIHPLYALGAQTHSYSPVTLGTQPESLGSSLASAGQDISRAMNATRTAPERADAYSKTIQDLTLTKFGLENELLASQIKKINHSINPPLPTVGDPHIPIPKEAPEKREAMYIDGNEIKTNPATSNTSGFEKRYGDEIGGIAGGLAVGWSDLKHNFRHMNTGQFLNWIDRATRIW